MTNALTETVRQYAIKQAEVALHVAASMNFDEDDPASITKALARLDAARESLQQVRCAVLSMSSELSLIQLRAEVGAVA